MDLTPTPSQTVGPYLHLGLTDTGSVPCIAGKGVKGERVWLTFRVLDGDSVPVPDAMIELWQADSEGNYKGTEGHGNSTVDGSFRGFGRMPTAEDGSCSFETVKPGPVPGPGDTIQAPHINVSIMARGLLKRLSTRAYFAGEPGNASDPVLALIPENRRPTLLAQPDPTRAGGWIFEVRLCGEGETVFFDV
ncbi:MAG: protocatechuate 3,4-dioxygenase subunit alpha [Acidobacteriia bacterium]|nr:protocatechuate 3,4-dioxygenase subunit alpha [Terriglobia bacterium]